MSDSPAVLHVVWNLIRGGTEGQCARVAMACARSGARHRVAVFRREGFFLDAVESACGPVYTLDIRTLKSPATLARIWALSRFIRNEHIDLVHCWDADAALFGSLAARWARVPFITSRRDLGEIYAGWKLKWMAQADRRARAVVVNANAIRDRLVAQGLDPAKMVTIPNILDVDEFDALAAQPYSGADALPAGRWVVMVARLDPEKDVGTVLRAAARLKTSHPDVRWIVAGDGRERPALEQMTRDLGVHDRILFPGEVNEVPALLRCAQVGVLTPNANEGLSNTILEYMAAGLPVVATDCGGNAELVRDGATGHVIGIGDDAALAARVASLLDDEEAIRRFGRAGRAVIEGQHRPVLVAQRFMDVYRHG
jgi:glycosyltransferase involved in cell wall biosynthesis